MGILLFNLLGYRAVFSWLDTQSSQQLDAQLDSDRYETASLITIKVPVDELPYYTNSPIFERVKGEVTIGGMKYQYVERRIYNDSLEMRCIPNAHSQQLTNARDAFFQLVNDLQHTSSSGKNSGKQAVSLKIMITEYLEESTLATFEPSFREVRRPYSGYRFYLPSNATFPQEQPPDA